MPSSKETLSKGTPGVGRTFPIDAATVMEFDDRARPAYVQTRNETNSRIQAALRSSLEHVSRDIAKGRVIGSAIFVVACAATVLLAHASWQRHLDFQRWVVETPMQVTVDLTTPSTYTTSFKQTCVVGHGQSIFVSLDDSDATEEVMRERLAGLEGELTIRDGTGTEIVTEPFSEETVRFWGDDPMLVSFLPFSNGDYTAEIKIQKGAIGLDGREHELYARNQLCGLEQLPVLFCGLFSAIAGLVAGVAGYCTLPSVLRDGFRVKAPQDAEPS